MVHNLSFQQHPHALTIPRARQTCMRTLTVFCNKIDRVFSMVWDNPSTWEWLHFCVLLPLVSFKSFMLQQKNSIHFIIQDQPPLTLTRHPRLVFLSRRQKNVSLIKLRTSSDTARKQCSLFLLWTKLSSSPQIVVILSQALLLAGKPCLQSFRTRHTLHAVLSASFQLGLLQSTISHINLYIWRPLVLVRPLISVWNSENVTVLHLAVRTSLSGT